MEEIDFKNGETTVSAETFLAFQQNIKNEFKKQRGDLTEEKGYLELSNGVKFIWGSEDTSTFTKINDENYKKTISLPFPVNKILTCQACSQYNNGLDIVGIYPDSGSSLQLWSRASVVNFKVNWLVIAI